MTAFELLYKTFFWRTIQFLLAIGNNIILAIYLGSSATGDFFSALYLFGTIGYIFCLGLDTSFVYFISKRQLSITKSLTIAALLGVSSAIIAFLLLNSFYTSVGNLFFSKNEFLLYGSLYVLSNVLTCLCTATMAGIGKYPIATISLALVSLLNLLFAAVVFAGSSGYDVEIYFRVYFGIYFIQALFLYFYLFAKQRLKTYAVKKIVGITNVFQYASTKFIIGLIFLFAVRFCIYLLPYSSVSDAEAGNFVQLFKLCDYLATVATFIYLPMVSLSAAQSIFKNTAMISFLLRVVNSGLVVLSVVILLAGDELFRFLFGDSFGLMSDLYWYMLPGLFAFCGSPFITAFYFGQNKMKYNFISGVLALVSVAASYFLLTDAWGVKGAAAAWSIGMFISYIYDLYIFNKVYKVPVSQLLMLYLADLQKLKSKII